MAIFNPNTTRKRYYAGRLTFGLIFLIGLLLVGGISWQQGWLNSLLPPGVKNQPSAETSQPTPPPQTPQSPSPQPIVPKPSQLPEQPPLQETPISKEETPQPQPEHFLLLPDSDCTAQQAEELQRYFQQMVRDLNLPSSLRPIVEHPDFLLWFVHGVTDFSEGQLTIHPTLQQLLNDNGFRSSFSPYYQIAWFPANRPETPSILHVLNWLDNEQNLIKSIQLYRDIEPLLAHIYGETISDDKQFRQKLHRTFAKITDFRFPKPIPELHKTNTIYRFANLRLELLPTIDKFLFRRGETLLMQLQQKIKEINAKISQQP